jgi:NTP pyrophosphatase (non-canonical NTP hydrolase)
VRERADDQNPVQVNQQSGEWRRTDITHALIAFHTAFGLPRQALPSIDVDGAVAELRLKLLAEEVDEYAVASKSKDLVGIADALADIVYVAYGAALTYGIDLDAVLSEVHRSNMSKLDGDGRPIYRSDGKVVKSDRYSPPDVNGVLAQQSPLPLHHVDDLAGVQRTKGY